MVENRRKVFPRGFMVAFCWARLDVVGTGDTEGSGRVGAQALFENPGRAAGLEGYIIGLIELQDCSVRLESK